MKNGVLRPRPSELLADWLTGRKGPCVNNLLSLSISVLSGELIISSICIDLAFLLFYSSPIGRRQKNSEFGKWLISAVDSCLFNLNLLEDEFV